jgi:hypothetical protein
MFEGGGHEVTIIPTWSSGGTAPDRLQVHVEGFGDPLFLWVLPVAIDGEDQDLDSDSDSDSDSGESKGSSNQMLDST